MNTRLAAMLLAFVTLAFFGCGIDQGGNSNPPPSGAATSTLLVSGPISGFGSVLVNDRTIETGNAVTLVNGSPGIEADLRAGQMVRVIAQVDGNAIDALFVEYRPNLSGPVQTLDPQARTLSILGQTIRTTPDTRYGPPGITRFEDIFGPARLVVSGIPTGSGEILATYIGTADPLEPWEITARITAVDAPALTFQLGVLTVDYSQAQLLDVPLGVPQAGQIVQVKGNALGAGAIADQVRAVRRLPGAFSSAANQIAAEELGAVGPGAAAAPLSVSFVGLIDNSNLPAAIAVDDVAVQLDAVTIVAGGAPTDLVSGRRIRVDGRVIDTGTVAATRITIF